jgi:hypothetical protein
MGWVVNATPYRFTHRIGGWVASRVGLDGCGKPLLIGIRSPDNPIGSESLYRLSYSSKNRIYDLIVVDYAF